MAENENSDTAAIKAIKKPGIEPSHQPDELTSDELTFQQQATLSPSQRAMYSERQLLALVKRDNHRLLRENTRLRPIEIEHSKLVYSRGWQVYLSMVSGLSVLGSGAIFSQCSDPSAWMSVGWGLLFLAAATMIGNAIIRPTAARAKPPKPDSK